MSNYGMRSIAYLETLACPDAANKLLELASLLEGRAVHDLPVVEHGLGEGLASGMLTELAVEAEGLHDGEVRLHGEHGRSNPLLLAEHLSTTLVEARVDTTDTVFGALNLDCKID